MKINRLAFRKILQKLLKNRQPPASRQQNIIKSIRVKQTPLSAHQTDKLSIENLEEAEIRKELALILKEKPLNLPKAELFATQLFKKFIQGTSKEILNKIVTNKQPTIVDFMIADIVAQKLSPHEKTNFLEEILQKSNPILADKIVAKAVFKNLSPMGQALYTEAIETLEEKINHHSKTNNT